MYDYYRNYNYNAELATAAMECTYAEKKAKRAYTEAEYRNNNSGSDYLGTFSMNDILDTYKYTMVGEAW